MQHHYRRFFARRTPKHSPRPWGVWSKGKKSSFSENGHDTYQINGYDTFSNIVANMLPLDPHTLGVGSKDQNSIFSEYGRVAYQIKGYDTCSNMVANILPTYPPPRPPPEPGGGINRSKFNFFRTWSCCIITKSVTL